MRYRFRPARPPIQEDLLDLWSKLDRGGDVAAALLMPVYLLVVSLVSSMEGFGVISFVIAAAAAVNCWPAGKGLRAIRLARRDIGR